MADILVLSSAHTHDESQWRMIRNSSAKHGVPLHMLGIGTPHNGMEGIRDGIAFLRTRSEDYIVITDGYDVVVNRWDERELKLRIDSAPHLIMSVETNVWPHGDWWDKHPKAVERYATLRDRGYKWFAICGGQYCGRREQLIEMWEEMMVRWDRGDSTAGGSSQEILHQMLGDGWPFTLDLRCEIFQSMLGPHTNEVQIYDDGVANNNPMDSTPMFIHFNGQGLTPEVFINWCRELGYE